MKSKTESHQIARWVMTPEVRRPAAGNWVESHSPWFTYWCAATVFSCCCDQSNQEADRKTIILRVSLSPGLDRHQPGGPVRAGHRGHDRAGESLNEAINALFSRHIKPEKESGLDRVVKVTGLHESRAIRTRDLSTFNPEASVHVEPLVYLF